LHLQFISSAIGYDPPDGKIVIVLDKFSGTKAKQLTHTAAPSHGGRPAIASPSGPPAELWETIGWLFSDPDTRPAGSVRFANRNNFLELDVVPGSAVATGASGDAAPLGAAGPALRAVYHVRRGTMNAGEGAKPDLECYEVVIPPLVAAGPVHSAAVAAWQAKLGGFAPQRPTGLRALPCIGPCFACMPCMGPC
jgi:hypothetical protein